MNNSFNRRTFLKRSLQSAAQAAAASSLYGVASAVQAATDSVVQNIAVGSGVNVPAKFLGMHFHYWPSNVAGPVSAPPGFAYGTWRSHDYYGIGGNGFRWMNLNPTRQATVNAIYSSAPAVWAELDKVIQMHSQAGRDIYFTLYGTPAWAARNGFGLKPTGIGVSAPPENQADLALFVKALVKRYNYAGSPTPIRHLEVWNEPNVRGNSVCTCSGQVFNWKFTESAGFDTGLPLVMNDEVFFTSTGTLPTGLTAGTVYYVRGTNGSSFAVSATLGGAPISVSHGSGDLTCHFLNTFFWGQSTDMAAMAKTVYQAAKAIDSKITVVTPGFTGGLNPRDNQVSSFLNAGDGQGGHGRDWCDALAFHPYDTTLNGMTSPPQLAAVIQAIRSFMIAGGLPATTPLMISEQGWQPPSATAQSYFISNPESIQAKKIVRHAMVSAASGMKKHIFYVYDGPYLGGVTVANSPEKQSLLNWFNNTICGKKIISCEILSSGAVRVALSNGQVHTV